MQAVILDDDLFSRLLVLVFGTRHTLSVTLPIDDGVCRNSLSVAVSLFVRVLFLLLWHGRAVQGLWFGSERNFAVEMLAGPPSYGTQASISVLLRCLLVGRLSFLFNCWMTMELGRRPTWDTHKTVAEISDPFAMEALM